jgi:hypothetical protein
MAMGGKLSEQLVLDRGAERMAEDVLSAVVSILQESLEPGKPSLAEDAGPELYRDDETGIYAAIHG